MNRNTTPIWDLSGLYSGVSDPIISKDKKDIQKLTNAFTKNYKGKINSVKITSKLLTNALKEYESLSEKLYIYANYASYLHAQDTSTTKIGAFYQESQEFVTDISSKLLWFSLEIQEMPEKTAKKLMNSSELKEYKHYLSNLRVFAPYTKSLAEEEILTKMSQTGSDAFVRFYDEQSSAETFNYKKKKLSYAEIGAILKDDPKEENRKIASKSYTETYKNNEKFYTYVLNTLLLDKKTTDEIRGYQYPQQATFLSYEVNPETVNALIKSVEKNYKVSEDFYTAKSKLLKRNLYEWDRYSKVYYNKAEQKITWQEAKSIVLTSFREFDEEMANIAQKFFENGWIDAKVSNTKKGGAFCSYCVPSKNPFILMSFTGTVDDVMTLAHELGHGIHAYLSRNNSLLNYYPSTATAEIASVFAESLVFDYLYKNTKSKEEKINLLANKIQGGFATIFRQTLFYLFEVEIHNSRREKGELSSEQISNIFQKKLQKMFGRGLTLTDQHKYWWMPILHFYHYNFYVFTYAFGEALTLALYQQYKLEGKEFVSKYKGALKVGGSKSPQEIISKMGIDISNSNFWQEGIDLLRHYVTEFKDLLK